MYFETEDEDELTKVILKFQAAGFPLNLSKVCSLAYQFADLNNIKGFSSKSKKAGRKWAKFYLKCYPKIRVKKASNLPIARVMAANEPNVHKWFDEYEQVLKDLGINSPEQIWSGDETGVQNVPKEQLVVGATGTPANQTVSDEQGETSTILSFVNGVGLVCPPMVIHRGQCVQQYWTHNVPVGWHVAATTKGYIMKHKFHGYGIHFVHFLKTQGLLNQKHLLIIDSHKSHVYSVAFFEEMLESNIHVLPIPPHTSHIVQALDSTPFAQFKKNWQRLLLDYNFEHHGQVVGKGDFFKLLVPAWRHAMTVGRIQSGFRKMGIYPVNFEAMTRLNSHLVKLQTVRKYYSLYSVQYLFVH